MIENLNHLAELRVLNLAGNQISNVDNLSGMDSLAELNLRRNRIRTVVRGEFYQYSSNTKVSFKLTEVQKNFESEEV